MGLPYHGCLGGARGGILARMHPLRALLLVALCALPAACGGGTPSGGCAAGVRSLAILEPSEGQMLTTARTTLLVQTCGFDRDEQVVVRLLQPFETDYAFATVPELGAVLSADVPLLPGTMEFVAQSRDGAVRSASVTVTSMPPP